MKKTVILAILLWSWMGTSNAATSYTWIGSTAGLWSEPGNWSPTGTPGSDTADTIQIIADPVISTTIIADVSCTIQSIASSGKVIIRGTLDSTGEPKHVLDCLLTNSGYLDIWNMKIKGQIVNQAGAMMKLRGIRGSVQIDNNGELRWYLINVLDDASFITNYNKMLVIDPGVLDSYGSMMNTGALSINFSSLIFEAGATLTNEGTVYGSGNLFVLDAPLSNSGTIKAMSSDLVVLSTGDFVNEGFLYNEAGTHLLITTQGPTPLVNYGQIRTLSGGGVSVYSSSVINESGGVIQLKGGFLRASIIDIEPNSTIQGRGELIGSLYIDPNVTADFYKEMTITGSLQIDPLAELTLSDGELLVEGTLLNDGIIHLKSSRILPRNGIVGDGRIIWDISDYNTLTDYNFDGTVNMADLAVFAQTWLWQSPMQTEK